jgi:hypothetical protein
MESMKMVINLEVKKAGGRLSYVARPGQALFPGTLIARLDDQGDVTASKPQEFLGYIEEWKLAETKRRSADVRLDTRFDAVLQACKDILNGYAVPESLFQERKKQLVDDLFSVLDDKRLPFALFKLKMDVVETRMSRMTNYNQIRELIKQESEFKAVELADQMQNYFSSLNPSDAGLEKQHFDELLRICERFEHGLEGKIIFVF